MNEFKTIIKEYRIFVDTCALMHPKAKIFFSKILLPELICTIQINKLILNSFNAVY